MKKKIVIISLFIILLLLIINITTNKVYAKIITLDGTTNVAPDHTWLCDCYDVDDVDCRCKIQL